MVVPNTGGAPQSNPAIVRDHVSPLPGRVMLRVRQLGAAA